MFTNRTDAGRQLANTLDDLDVTADVVLAIPRGGLPVARVVADSLQVPLDIVAARKLGAPGNPELAIGAVASDGTVWINESLVRNLDIGDAYIDDHVPRERAAAQEKVDTYRGDRPPLDVQGKTVLIVDDGMATGATTTACVRQVKNAGAERVIVAVPVSPPDTVDRLRSEADEVISVEMPPHFSAVGQFYESFEQVPDDRAMEYLRREE